ISLGGGLEGSERKRHRSAGERHGQSQFGGQGGSPCFYVLTTAEFKHRGSVRHNIFRGKSEASHDKILFFPDTLFRPPRRPCRSTEKWNRSPKKLCRSASKRRCGARISITP